MNSLLKISAVVLSVTAQQCVSFQPVSLDDTYYKPKVEETRYSDKDDKGIPALAYNGGDLLQGNWWSGGGDMSLATKNGNMEVTCKNVGPRYTPFGMEVGALDFTGGLAIKMVARVEGDETPVISLQFDDFEGIQSNGKRPTKRIDNSEEFKEYYFVIDDSETWSQTWPVNATVNGELIQKVLVFPNPGQAGFTGKLIIKELKVIKQSEMGEDTDVKLPVGKDGGVIANFESGTGDWWASNDKIPISFNEEQKSLEVNCNGVGPGWDCIGSSFPTINALNAYELEIWARIDEGTEPPEIRADLKDPDGFTTNARPATARIMPSTEFKKYTLRYRGAFIQSWPERQKVDGQRIKDIVIFINGGKAPWTGKLYIQKMEFKFTGVVEVVDDTPKLEKEEPNTSVVSAGKKDFSWSASEKISVAISGKETVVTAEGADKSNAFVKAFRPIDFAKNPVLKVRAKASSDVDLGLALSDVYRVTSESLPVVQTIKAGDYADYIFDFSSVVNPESGLKISAEEIFETIFMLQPNGGTFNGKLFVESIEAVSSK